jgi:hypothetical protein
MMCGGKLRGITGLIQEDDGCGLRQSVARSNMWQKIQGRETPQGLIELAELLTVAAIHNRLFSGLIDFSEQAANIVQLVGCIEMKVDLGHGEITTDRSVSAIFEELSE